VALAQETLDVRVDQFVVLQQPVHVQVIVRGHVRPGGPGERGLLSAGERVLLSAGAGAGTVAPDRGRERRQQQDGGGPPEGRARTGVHRVRNGGGTASGGWGVVRGTVTGRAAVC